MLKAKIRLFLNHIIKGLSTSIVLKFSKVAPCGIRENFVEIKLLSGFKATEIVYKTGIMAIIHTMIINIWIKECFTTNAALIFKFNTSYSDFIYRLFNKVIAPIIKNIITEIAEL